MTANNYMNNNATINSVDSNTKTVIILDRTALSHPSVMELCLALKKDGFFKNRNGTILIPYSTGNALKGKANNPNNSERHIAEKALDCAEKIARYYGAQVGETMDRINETDEILSYGVALRAKADVILVTDNSKLACQFRELRRSASFRVTRTVEVARLNDAGELVPYDQFPDVSGNDEMPISPAEIYDLSAAVIPEKGEKLEVKELPVEGSRVQLVYQTPMCVPCDCGQLQLTRLIADGGEGYLYETTLPNTVVKIFGESHITRFRYEKLKLMLSKPVRHARICYPEKLVLNAYGDLVGYSMKKAKGITLEALLGRVAREGGNWNRQSLVELSVSILELITYLHSRNILIGDVHPSNIMVASPKEVYLIDTDSFQVNGYPCTGKHGEFMPPELRGASFAERLRSMAHENYAVSILLFKIMMLDKHPYAASNGESRDENAARGMFPYPFLSHREGTVPDGHWKYIWSNLLGDAKSLFWNTFHHDGDRFSPESRPSSSEWLAVFRKYLTLMPKLIEKDSQMGMLIPGGYKRAKPGEYGNCVVCGRDTPMENLISTTDGLLCHSCDKTRRQALWKSFVCRDCGENFDVSVGDHEYYLSMGYPLPKSCPACRKLRKERGDPRTVRISFTRDASPTPEKQAFFTLTQAPTTPPPARNGYFDFLRGIFANS